MFFLQRLVGLIATTFEKLGFILIVTFSLPSPSSFLKAKLLNLDAHSKTTLSSLPFHFSPDQQVEKNDGDQGKQVIQQEQRQREGITAEVRVPVFLTSNVFVVVAEVHHIRNDCEDASNPNNKRDNHGSDELHLTKQVARKENQSSCVTRLFTVPYFPWNFRDSYASIGSLISISQTALGN